MRIEEIVGRNVREAREAAGLTQEELGKQIENLLGREWPRQTVSIAEKGGRSFTASELLALSLVTRVSVAGLFTPPVQAREVTFPSGYAVPRQVLTDMAFTGDDPNRIFSQMQETVRRLTVAWVDTLEQTKEQGAPLGDLQRQLNAAIAAWNRSQESNSGGQA